MADSVYDQIGTALADPPSSDPGTGSPAPDSAPTPPATPTESPVEPTKEEPAGDGTTGDTAKSDTTTDTTVATTQTEEENPYETDTQEELPKATLDTVLATPRGKEIYNGYKVIREISKPVEQGGLGFMPTVENLREYYRAFSGRAVMDEHMNSGDPQGAKTFLGFVFDPKRGQGSQAMAANLADTLSASNPEAYIAASMPFVGKYETALWERWAEEPAGEAKDALYQAAQRIHKDLTGDWKSLKELGLAQPEANAQPDPLAEERERLRVEADEIAQARRQDYESFVQNWNAGVANQIGTNLYAELDKALAPLKAAHANSPRIYASLRKDFHDTVVNSLPANKNAWDVYQTKLSEARRLGTQDAAKSVAEYFIRMAQPAILQHRSTFLKEAGIAVKNNSVARHAELASIDSRKGVNGVGTSPTPSAGPPLTRNPGETESDFILRQIRS